MRAKGKKNRKFIFLLLCTFKSSKYLNGCGEVQPEDLTFPLTEEGSKTGVTENHSRLHKVTHLGEMETYSFANISWWDFHAGARILIYSDLARMVLGEKGYSVQKRNSFSQSYQTALIYHSFSSTCLGFWFGFLFFLKLFLTPENELKKKIHQYHWIWSCLHLRSDLAKEYTSHLDNGLWRPNCSKCL